MLSSFSGFTVNWIFLSSTLPKQKNFWLFYFLELHFMFRMQTSPSCVCLRPRAGRVSAAGPSDRRERVWGGRRSTEGSSEQSQFGEWRWHKHELADSLEHPHRAVIMLPLTVPVLLMAFRVSAKCLRLHVPWVSRSLLQLLYGSRIIWKASVLPLGRCARRKVSPPRRSTTTFIKLIFFWLVERFWSGSVNLVYVVFKIIRNIFTCW